MQFAEQLDYRARPLEGQKDPFRVYGHVVLEPIHES